MSDTSGRTYRELAIPYFLEVFKIVDEVMKNNHTPYYLIGVNATDLQLLEKGYKPARGTKDIDFAIMVPSFENYDKIKQDLIAKGFNQVKDLFTLYYSPYNAVIDLLPFGQIEENDTINFTEREVLINVLGFKETLEDPNTIKLDDVLSVKVPPLHGMVVLKLISWSDRPEVRGNDLEDIFRIVKHYYEMEGDAVFDEHFDLLEQEPFDEKLIAARIMGRRIAEILKKSHKLKERVMSVIEENSNDPVKSSIGKHWASAHGIDVDYAIGILKNIKAGIEDKDNK